ncbi:hypothetical protein M0R89_11585 [Halorussus limi]|uniref:Uncharacterized protein n=1 Tax=Halorussus limi TaxID=2938695 RepID=A0A8U0HQN9_9EURY|nr:hypothetical protein [Halorussus limi]UPV73189.1 hypothetical protein M0R89_11585 [Halorussus limi]
MAVVKATCDRRPGRGTITFTGVDSDGELRECPSCGCEVAVDPEADAVMHVEAR